MKSILITAALLLLNTIVLAQTPFTCTGEIYISLYNVGATTTLNEVEINTDGTATELDQIDLTNNNNYVAGDVTPSGDYLVVIAPSDQTGSFSGYAYLDGLPSYIGDTIFWANLLT